MLAAILSLALLAGTPRASHPASQAVRSSAALGLAVNLPETASDADRRKALEEARRSGVTLFALEVSWSAAEPRPRQYDVSEVTRTARLLRQSGATLHLDLPLVKGRARDLPSDLAATAFDDPKLSVRLGRLLDALGPALLDFSTLSLGNEADSYFADKPEELRAYRRLFDGAVEFLEKKTPRLAVGVTTAAPTESRAPLVAAALHQKSPVLFYVYSPFFADDPFVHRPPAALERDWKAILRSAAGRPVAFTEVSFSSALENASSPEKQAEFVGRLRRFLAAADGSRLLFARYVSWRDVGPSSPSETQASPDAPRRGAFFANRGLRKSDGSPKPAWREWMRNAAAPR